MASNVFGKPVTEGTRLERAATARKDPNADNKRDEAIAYVRNQKAKSGDGVSTLCIFYNATGETLYYDQEHSWYGRVWDLYPMEVQNGQWGAFLHVKNASTTSGSMAFVTYRVEANNNAVNTNRAFCDVYDDGKSHDNDKIYKNLNRSARQVAVRKKGMWMTATIESDTSPLFQAHFNLDGA
ncbi:hypothetical protein Tco_1148376 [Tanacetum coccineum]